MKARIKGTDRIVDCEEIVVSPAGNIKGFKCRDINSEMEIEEVIPAECLIEIQDFDWQSFRAEAVKAFIAASITHGTELKSIDEVVDTCIYIADLLIDKLKRKEKREMNYDEKIVKESASLEEAAARICSYGYYDTKGVSKEDVLKYMKLGALWQEQQMTEDAKDAWVKTYESPDGRYYAEFVIDEPPANYRGKKNAKIIIVKVK
ncbi:MAG: hypothetical protein K5920_09450 [Bacteroidales bacterium]|nr:hypothetical protein [Bacteroidales bacterium]